ncbi:Na+:solute symporter [Superficieibacter electus]|uniref:Na+:solute symporter n=1 Tax=Superficieibacter electus TaxID=2022662 RepID=A0A2P5GRI8_9ENTR|nr:sodium:solute symporter family protein [Superficieibacter electus]POP45863.1 Na+:solute symporter [Superficieibacter electus]POP49170.1 Na+:solute symporter [Superficieibacter electus]
MNALDYIVMALYALMIVAITLWAMKRVDSTRDFFAAGGKMPWWLSGVSHHMSGYSAAVFVAYAAVAYNAGITIYFWWALPIALAVLLGAWIFAPRWARLRIHMDIESPMEYLAMRYNRPTQQVLAWSGVMLKTFDVGAKWAAIAIIINVFTGLDPIIGMCISGTLSMFYTVMGGLWADACNDFGQFIVQFVAAIVMVVAVAMHLGGFGELVSIFERLPAHHTQIIQEPYTLGFILAYLVIYTLSYNGGTWNLAQRFIASPGGREARKAALLSSALYLIWPLVLFLPMWAAPLIYPTISDPSRSYSIMAMDLLPNGLIGLVLIAMFTHTLSMTSSDANAITAVVTRDILPAMWPKKFKRGETSLLVARTTAFLFIITTLIIAVNASRFGGVLSLLVIWFGGLVGPGAIPMLLGLLPWFRRSGSAAAIVSWATGVSAFFIVKFVLSEASTAMIVAAPVLLSLAVYVGFGWLRPSAVRPEVDHMLAALSAEADRASVEQIPDSQEV